MTSGWFRAIPKGESGYSSDQLTSLAPKLVAPVPVPSCGLGAKLKERNLGNCNWGNCEDM